MNKELCSHQHTYHNTMVITGLISHSLEDLAHTVLTLPQQHKLGSGCKPDLTALDSTSSLSGPAGQQATLVTHLVLEAKGVPKLSSEWQGLCRAPFLRFPRSSSLSVQGASVAELVPESGSK